MAAEKKFRGIDLHVLITGDKDSGKTCFTAAALDGLDCTRFERKLHGTCRVINLHGGTVILIESDHRETKATDRDADGCIITVDLTNKKSFDYAKEKLARRTETNAKYMLLATKTDLKDEHKIDVNDVKLFAKENGVFFAAVSADDVESASSVLKTFAYELLEQYLNENSAVHSELPQETGSQKTERLFYKKYDRYIQSKTFKLFGSSGQKKLIISYKNIEQIRDYAQRNPSSAVADCLKQAEIEISTNPESNPKCYIM